MIREKREQQQDRLAQPLVDDDVASRGDLGDAGGSGVEQRDRLDDRLGGPVVSRGQLAAVLPELVYRLLETVHHASRCEANASRRHESPAGSEVPSER